MADQTPGAVERWEILGPNGRLGQFVRHSDYATLAAENAALVVDARRLDWLERNEAHLVSHHEAFGVDDPECEYTIWWNVVKGRKSISGHPLGSVRAAIDAALARATEDAKDG